MLADDPDLLEDLKKLKRQTKNAQVSAQNSLARVTLLGGEEGQDDENSSDLTKRQVDSTAERATKSIGDAITNSQMQNYYKAYNKQGGMASHPSTKALYMNSHPFSNYKPLPD